MENQQDRIVTQFFQTLCDETRLKILGMIAVQPRTSIEIAAALGLEQPQILREIATLRHLGLVLAGRDGSAATYSFDPEALESLRSKVLSDQTNPSPADSFRGEEWERQVLQSSFEGQALRQIPKTPEKRMVVLRWLAGQFREHRRYEEKEVNDTLKRHHPDFALLRRYLVDYGLMHREYGVYWRLPPDQEIPMGPEY